jgi:hypothetical protein
MSQALFMVLSCLDPTCLGWALFGGFAATFWSVTGIAVSFVGSGWYSYIKLKEGGKRVIPAAVVDSEPKGSQSPFSAPAPSRSGWAQESQGNPGGSPSTSAASGTASLAGSKMAGALKGVALVAVLFPEAEDAGNTFAAKSTA